MMSYLNILALRVSGVSLVLEAEKGISKLGIKWHISEGRDNLREYLVSHKDTLLALLERENLPVKVEKISHFGVDFDTFGGKNCDFLTDLLPKVSEIAYTEHTSGTGGVLVFQSERTGMYLFSKQEAQECEAFTLLGRLAALVLTSGDVLRL